MFYNVYSAAFQLAHRDFSALPYQKGLFLPLPVCPLGGAAGRAHYGFNWIIFSQGQGREKVEYRGLKTCQVLKKHGLRTTTLHYSSAISAILRLREEYSSKNFYSAVALRGAGSTSPLLLLLI
jgi:hypothetical protein